MTRSPRLCITSPAKKLGHTKTITKTSEGEGKMREIFKHGLEVM